MNTLQVLLINLTLLLTIVGSAEVKRDKRTIDFVIRGFADVFGYDVLKRPAVITTLAPAAGNATVKPAAPGGPKVAPPTFFPPPVAPLPPPKFPLVPRATPGTPAKPPAPPRVTAPPLLTETVRKSFNFNLNWNRKVPQAPQSTAAMPTVVKMVPTSPAASGPMATMPHAAPQTPVGKNNAVPLTEQNIQYLYDDIEPHRFKAINKENAYNDYHEDDEPRNLPVAQIISPMIDDPYNNYHQSKDKFKESITEFWNHSPYYRDQKGYKFLTTPETNDVVKSLEPEKSKYEEYDLRNVDYDEDKQSLNDDSKEYVDEDENNPRENLQYNDNDIEEEDHGKKDFRAEKDNYRAAESKETLKYPKGQAKNNTTKVETIIVTKTSCNHQKSKPQASKIKKNIEIQEIKNPAYHNDKDLTEIILPQFSGVLPIAIDHLSQGEKNYIPWPIPFDTEASETKNNNKGKKKTFSQKYEIDPRRRRMDLNVEKLKRTVTSDSYNTNNFRYIPDRYDASSFKYKPDSYNPRFDYVAPEEHTENYAKYEALEDSEDDEDLKKAQVFMRSFGTRLNIVKSNGEITNLN